MSSQWRSDEGWPYADSVAEEVDHRADADDDLISLRAERHLLDGLEPLERQVITARFGLTGTERTMKQLHNELGVPRAELRSALGSGLAKLRTHLSA